MRPSLYIRDVELPGYGRTNVRAMAGRLESIGHEVVPATGDVIIQGGGGALIPGLHDNHAHLLSMAAATLSFDCKPPVNVRRGSDLATRLAHHLADRPTDPLRGIRYDELSHGWLDRQKLDAISRTTPIRLQHRSGHAWVMNSAALQQLSHSETITEEMMRTGWLVDVPLPPDLAAGTLNLRAIGARMSSFGITGVHDATPGLDYAALTILGDAHADGSVPQHITVMSEVAQAPANLTVGPRKIMPAATSERALATIENGVTAARDQGRGVAVHCVTTEHLVIALMVLAKFGFRTDDRIEHGNLIPADLLLPIAEAGIAVVAQPQFVAERGDHYLTALPDETENLIRLKSLLNAGIPTRIGTDAPFASADPWAVICSAITRRTSGGVVLGMTESITAAEAIGMLNSASGPHDRPDPAHWHNAGTAANWLQPGAPADWCLLRAPWAVVADNPSAKMVSATFIGGVTVWRTGCS